MDHSYLSWYLNHIEFSLSNKQGELIAEKVPFRAFNSLIITFFNPDAIGNLFLLRNKYTDMMKRLNWEKASYHAHSLTMYYRNQYQ